MIRLPKSNNQGLTLIELMVSLAIFLVVLIVVTSIFLTAIKNQRKAFVTQNLQDNARYIIEVISKEVRMSEIQSVAGPDKNLFIKNQEGIDIQYQFHPATKTIRRNDGGPSGPQEINSSRVRVDGEFYVIKGPTQKPRVTIVMRVYPADADEPEIRIQNTITSRTYVNP